MSNYTNFEFLGVEQIENFVNIAKYARKNVRKTKLF